MATKQERDRNRREAIKQYVQELKKQPCADCGIAYPDCIAIMEFDHVRGKKVASINSLIKQRASLETIKKEIAKCDLVCCLHHRMRTEKRRLGIPV